MRTFIYCRVSREEQATEEHYSLEYQEQMARNRIREKERDGWHIVKVRKDIGSGKSIDRREGYQELLEDIQSDRIDAVVVYKLDRLSRNVRDVYDFIDLTQNVTQGKKVDFISLTENFDTTTAMGRAMLGVAAVFAQLTRETIAENVKNGLLQRASRGLWNGGQNASLGYDYSNEYGLTVNPQEAEIVHRIFELYNTQKLSVGRIAKQLNLERVPRRYGGDWNSSQICLILKNPIYIGKLRYADVVNEGHHEPIISQETYDAVQQRLASRRREQTHPRTHTTEFLLSGLIYCGHCGWRMRAQQKSPTHKRYRCSGNQKAGQGACKGLMRRAENLEDLVAQQIKRLAMSEQVQKIALEQAQSLVQDKHASPAEEQKRLERELAKVKEGFHRWADQLDDGTINQAEFTERIAKLRERRQGLEQRLAELEATALEREQVEFELEKLKGVLMEFDQLWAVGTPEEKKELVRSVVEKVVVGRDTMTVKLMFLPEVTVELPRKKGPGRPRKQPV